MKHVFIRLGLASAALAWILGAPFAVQAQQPPPPMPSYATGEESVHGTVSGFDGKYDLTVRDQRGFTDNVQLHDGTVINPTGLRLASGMTVTIYGHADGSHFVANEVDTPYHHSYAYGPYPYPYYGSYPYYGYPYYPAVGLGFGFRFR
jgi:hypothetical protein